MAGKRKKNKVLRAEDIVQALTHVTKEKSISIELVLDSLKDALASAAQRFLNSTINVEINVDREKGIIEAFTVLNVVEEVENHDQEIALVDALKIDPGLELGDEVVGELDIDDFGRTAIQTAKQIIMQRVREHERQKIFDDYSERIGELATGTVQQLDKGNILINLGRTEALLPYREQIRQERYRQGDTIKATILDVRDNIKGPQVIVSRTSASFLERLFEIEVPEIFEGIVKIVKVVRAPGYRAKVAVITNDIRVDPVGACVGMRGNRVQAIVRELSNERMDIINWTGEENLLVRRVFSPAEVKRVIPVGDTHIVVIVPELDLAQAIGKEGQNIRLAARLLDKEIDIYGENEFSEFSDAKQEDILTEKKLESNTIVEAVIEETIHDDENSDNSFETDELSSNDDEDIIVANTDESKDDETPVQAIIKQAVDEDVEEEFTVEEESDTQNSEE